MIKGLFGPTSLAHLLRGGLEETMLTSHQIAERVAGALKVSSSTDFDSALDAAKAKQTGKPDEVDLQRDMAELADTQIRYEAEARLLRGTYSSLRTAIKGNTNA